MFHRDGDKNCTAKLFLLPRAGQTFILSGPVVVTVHTDTIRPAVYIIEWGIHTHYRNQGLHFLNNNNNNNIKYI